MNLLFSLVLVLYMLVVYLREHLVLLPLFYNICFHNFLPLTF